MLFLFITVDFFTQETNKEGRMKMARPIKETPILRGKDAERFSRIIKENEKKTVPAADYARAQETFKQFKLANS